MDSGVQFFGHLYIAEDVEHFYRIMVTQSPVSGKVRVLVHKIRIDAAVRYEPYRCSKISLGETVTFFDEHFEPIKEETGHLSVLINDADENFERDKRDIEEMKMRPPYTQNYLKKTEHSIAKLKALEVIMNTA